MEHIHSTTDARMDESCHVEPVQKIATAEEKQATAVMLLGVQGMGCPNCAARVRNSLLRLTGVTEADVDHLTGTADVEFNPELVTITALFDAVAQAGNDGRHHYRAYRLM
jgi:copper chaperone CopZ